MNIDPATAHRVHDFAYSLLGIHEIPDGSNRGPGVDRIESVCGIQGQPWCVCTVQWIAAHVYGHTIADRTANAYYLADYSDRNGWTVPRPIVGCFVVYHIGAGHAGTVVGVFADGTKFDAVEGNEGNAVRLVERDYAALRCTFIVPPDLRQPSSGPRQVYPGGAPVYPGGTPTATAQIPPAGEPHDAPHDLPLPGVA